MKICLFRGNLWLPLVKKMLELALICNCTCVESIAAMHANQTSQQVTTSLRSKLYCGYVINSNLTAVMSGLPSSQHTQDLTEFCSSKYGIITRSPDESRCVEKSSRKEGSSVTPPHVQHLLVISSSLAVPALYDVEEEGSCGKYLDSRGYSYR